MKKSLIFLLLMLLIPGLSLAAIMVPEASLMVNGERVEIPAEWQPENDGKTWTLNWLDPTGDHPVQNISVVGQTDPFINYAVGFINPFNSQTAFVLTLIVPYVGGPYNQSKLSHSSTATDGDDSGGATVGLNTELHKASALVDGVVVTGLATGCSITPPPSSQSCFTGADSIVPVVSGATGTLAVRLSFTLSPNDSYSATGKHTLENSSVPEPSTFLFVGAGLLAVGALGRRVTR
jgi:hypothetical protein